MKDLSHGGKGEGGGRRGKLPLEGPLAKECGWHSEAGKGKETNPSLEPSERNVDLLLIYWFSPSKTQVRLVRY